MHEKLKNQHVLNGHNFSHFATYRNTAITGLTLIDGKTTATSGRTAMPRGVSMELLHFYKDSMDRYIISLALSGWNAPSLWTACGTIGRGSLAT